MINDFLNKNPVFKPRIGVNLYQQRWREERRGELTENDLLERRKAKKKENKKNGGRRQRRENSADWGLLV